MYGRVLFNHEQCNGLYAFTLFAKSNIAQTK